MSLRGFRYLHRNRVLTLILILTLTSTMFLVTAFSFLSLYNGFTGYIGEEDGVVALHSNRGSTPLTTIVPTFLSENVSRLNGVIASSAEVIAPVTIEDKAIFIRGINPEEFSKLTTLTMVDGESLSLNDSTSTIVGKNLAHKLNLQVGDKILVYGLLSKTYAELTIKGIYASESIVDDESLVPLYVGQWLRGVSYNYVSIIRIKLDYTLTNIDTIYDELAKNATASTPAPTLSPTSSTNPKSLNELIPYTKIGYKISDLGIEDAKNLMEDYLSSFGVTKNTLIILSVIVMIFASGTAICALILFIDQHKRELAIIRMLGASTQRIKLDLITKVLSWSLISSLLGIILSFSILFIFNQVSSLQVLSHNITFSPDPLIIAANFVLISLLVSLQILRSDVK
jgi:ABC-type lipoprotein release transport system permease subunit